MSAEPKESAEPRTEAGKALIEEWYPGDGDGLDAIELGEMRTSILAIEDQAATEARRELLAKVRPDAVLLANAILGGTSYLPHRDAAERVLRLVEERP